MKYLKVYLVLSLLLLFLTACDESFYREVYLEKIDPITQGEERTYVIHIGYNIVSTYYLSSITPSVKDGEQIYLIGVFDSLRKQQMTYRIVEPDQKLIIDSNDVYIRKIFPDENKIVITLLKE